MLKLSKIIGLLFLLYCIGVFVYISISLRFPVFDIDKDPYINIIFSADRDNKLTAQLSATSFQSKYRFGGHFALNPAYFLAKYIFDNPKEYMLCLKDINKEVPYHKQLSNDWGTLYGWSYHLNRDDADLFLKNLPKNLALTEADLVEGKCTSYSNQKETIAKFAIYFEQPRLDTYVNKKLHGISLNQALDEAQFRLKYDAGFTQLNDAIRINCLSCIESLVLSGVTVNSPASDGKISPHTKPRANNDIRSPLQHALYGKNYDIFKYLLSQGAKDSLTFAASNETVQYLYLQIKYGSDVNEKDYDGRTPLEVAIRKKCIECVKLLVSNGANINALSRNQTPLNMALETNNYEMTKYLLDHGAKKHLVGRGFTAYDIVNRAGMVKDERIIKLIRNKQ